MKITVVIPNFNGIQYVERCLDSLIRQTFSEFDVIFVDNGSVDGSRELTEEKYPWVRVIALAENTGFCKAVNIGIEATQPPNVVLLNNDTETEPDYLQDLYRGIDMKKNAFIRKTVVLFLTIISVLGLQLISVNAKSPTYQQVPTMAYLKVESGQAYLSYANSAPQLFYEPMNGETVRLTQ